MEGSPRALRTGDRRRSATSVRFDAVDPGDEQAQAAMRAYFRELDDRFPTGFDWEEAATGDADALAPPTGVLLLARSATSVVGCGGVQQLAVGDAEIKRMWIHPEWRGLGVARRLLAELEAHARRLGHRRVLLDTNAELEEAMALYESSGYEPVERYNDNPYAQRWYAKPL